MLNRDESIKDFGESQQFQDDFRNRMSDFWPSERWSRISGAVDLQNKEEIDLISTIWSYRESYQLSKSDLE